MNYKLSLASNFAGNCDPVEHGFLQKENPMR